MSTQLLASLPRTSRAAAENRRLFDAAGTVCLNLIGAIGAGKTAVLEAILPRIQGELNVGVIAGDIETQCDARRISGLGVSVSAIPTNGGQDLTAEQVRVALGRLPAPKLDLVVIENVGSLTSQAAIDLGEHLRVAVLSVSGGHAVAAKHPLLFREAALILLTKFDLLPHVSFDLDGTVRALHRVNPRAEIICTDIRKRIGIDRVAGWLLGYVRAQRTRPKWPAPAREPVGLQKRCQVPFSVASGKGT